MDERQNFVRFSAGGYDSRERRALAKFLIGEFGDKCVQVADATAESQAGHEFTSITIQSPQFVGQDKAVLAQHILDEFEKARAQHGRHVIQKWFERKEKNQ